MILVVDVTSVRKNGAAARACMDINSAHMLHGASKQSCYCFLMQIYVDVEIEDEGDARMPGSAACMQSCCCCWR